MWKRCTNPPDTDRQVVVLWYFHGSSDDSAHYTTIGQYVRWSIRETKWYGAPSRELEPRYWHEAPVFDLQNIEPE
jgi:hypothetical protein